MASMEGVSHHLVLPWLMFIWCRMSALTRGVAVAVRAITGTLVERKRHCFPSCEHETACLWVVLSELRESLVVWSEVVAPLADAVSFINHKPRELPPTVEVP